MGDPSAPEIDKAEIRHRMRRIRRGLTDRPVRSERLCERLVAVPEVGAADRILVYSAVPGEPEIGPFVRWAAGAGKQTAVPEDDIDPAWPQVVVVPGLAFTADGHRLGQGGGWYDRFLAEVSPSCVTIGVCFVEQVVSSLPIEAHDVRLHRVVTDEGVDDG